MIERRQITTTMRVTADRLRADDRIMSGHDLLRVLRVTVADGQVELETCLHRQRPAHGRHPLITTWRVPTATKFMRVQVSRKIRMRPDLAEGAS